MTIKLESHRVTSSRVGNISIEVSYNTDLETHEASMMRLTLHIPPWIENNKILKVEMEATYQNLHDLSIAVFDLLKELEEENFAQ